MDPFGHPDLDRLARSMRLRLDETLDAEQSAARVAADRRSTMRDRLIMLVDRGQAVVVAMSDGHLASGIASAVGVDHLVVATDRGDVVIVITHIVSVEAR